MLRGMTQPSTLYQLIEERLDGTLADFVAARWPGRGWRKIAAEIEEATGIEVSHATLRLWFADRLEVRTFVRGDTPASAA